MHDAPRLRGGLPARILSLLCGLAVIAFGIVALLESRLGVPPWDVLHTGIAAGTALSVGAASVLVGLAVLVVGWALGARPGFGTVANAVVIGVLIDRLRALPWMEALAGAALPGRVGLVLLGIACFGLGSALYIGAGLGAGPRDGMMLTLSVRTGRRIALVRGAMEAAVLVVGFLLGGALGLGTAVFALAVGPAVEGSFWLFVRLGLAEPAAERALLPR
jgi:uncharacterized membrane protein YczE